MKVRLRPLLAGVAVAAALVSVLLLGSVDSARGATTFNPVLKVAVDGPAPGASSDFTSNLNIPDGDVNFAAFIAFIPPEWGVVTGDKIPVGAQVGMLDAQSVLGLANGACNQTLPVHFDMLNGSINLNDTVSFQDTDKSGTADYADDKDGDGNYDSVTKYPEWLLRVFKDDTTNKPLQPIRRSTGITLVAGIPVILQFLIFPPGTLIATGIPNDASLGFPSVTALQNIGDPDVVPAPSIINDFCTPLDTVNISNGKTKDGVKLLVNPGDGVYKFGAFALGQRDADADSYENSLDTCQLKPNVGNPRVTGDGDLDGDGLDQACDPNDNETNSDQDLDGYQNRGDNCPTVANGEEQANIPGVGNQKDTDSDQIGDACDPNPTTPDGAYSVSTPSVDVTIGTGGSGPGAKVTRQQCADCWFEGTVLNTGGSGTSSTPKPSATTSGSATPKPTVAPADTGGSNTGTIVAIVVGVAAAVIIIGGGAMLLMRRRSSP